MEKKEQVPHINVDFFEDLTGDISKAAPESVEEVGNRIKTLREEKGISLDELSNMTGFSVDVLSQIESGEMQPQLGTMIKLSKALDSAFGRLVSGLGEKIYSITRKEDQRTVFRSASLTGKKKLYTYKSLAPEVKGRHMESLLVQLEENPEEETSVHEGEEFIYVLKGVVLLKIGEESFELEPGDSAYYLSTTPHVLGSKEGSATILAVLYEG